jgi:hypothetical protein
LVGWFNAEEEEKEKNDDDLADCLRSSSVRLERRPSDEIGSRKERKKERKKGSNMANTCSIREEIEDAWEDICKEIEASTLFRAGYFLVETFFCSDGVTTFSPNSLVNC